ncbi:Transcription initiation factor IIB-2 [Auxenochlorella protothecoides]|uniref:General transcription factor TFIIB n=1 Tax=Auxenochlorella protothecoides TaxID=3075 RepID=A0A087SEC6_AUXPR|nr:Transcription initiation factor IIB-2 [Auxenochlorella protothecoides]KFM24080.1 Transcription initiation factor IIB-2 [Auxenochlorella protothecoides]RMZ55323.1 hypothetical protein APUTEX25_003461 [Auxenochlorella protothecoides]|eukprot:RMZ55323.1 hypothetical protein APUTEX25_003461 [Auxenochlorella protothecoides]
MAGYNVALRMKFEQRCPECGESDFVEDHSSGDLICRSCGMVVEAHVIDERSEWRTFAEKEIGKMYKSIVADLRLKETGGWLSEAGSNHPANYMRRNMSKLAMDNADMRRGVGLANAALPQSGPETAEHAPWHGKSPPSIVGAVIHVVALLPTASRRPSLEDISKACGVAEATIKAVYRDMYPHLARLFQKMDRALVNVEDAAKLPAPA